MVEKVNVSVDFFLFVGTDDCTIPSTNAANSNNQQWQEKITIETVFGANLIKIFIHLFSFLLPVSYVQG